MTCSNSVEVSNNGLSYKQLIDLFNGQFLSLLNTCLEAGHPEPVYLPATKMSPARVCFRADYPSSALHEIAHWCIAGSDRRELEDYGYWYEPDGRSGARQKAFEKVEVKPQALEWIFSIAAGIKFRISADNLDASGEAVDSSDFAAKVVFQAQQYLQKGLPERAEDFCRAILDSGRGKQPEVDDFKLEKLT